MSYLTEKEITTYCGLVSGVEMAQVEAASVLIDAYKGCSFLPQEHVERVDLSYKRSSGETRGKLKHYPRISVLRVKAKVPSPFGQQVIDLDESTLMFDDDESLYFSFEMPRGYLFRGQPKYLTVTYQSGYKTIPEPIKRACGILACNIKQMGGVMRWKSRDDYDIKVTLGNEGVFTEEIKNILRGVDVQ